MKKPEVGKLIRFKSDQTVVLLRHPSNSRDMIWAIPASFHRVVSKKFVNKSVQDILISDSDKLIIRTAHFGQKGWKVTAERYRDGLIVGFYMRMISDQGNEYVEVVQL